MIELDGIQLLVFGGCYSNLAATQTIRAEAERLHIPASNCIGTGDYIAYGAHPKESLALLRDWGCQLVQGNVEASLGANAEDCGCNFVEGSLCDALSPKWYNFAKASLNSEEKTFLANLPKKLRISWQGLMLDVIHGGFSDQGCYLFPSTPESDFAQELAHTEADVVLCGHSGLPFTRTLQGQIWHNAGSVGMPANDGTSDTWYSVLTLETHDEKQGLRLQHKRMHYPKLDAKAAMEAAKLPQSYADALTTGLWPAIDILPEAEKALTGQALVEDEIYIPFEEEEQVRKNTKQLKI